MLDVHACQAFGLPLVSARNVRMLVYAMIVLLYLAAWMEVIRIFRARW